MAIAVVMMLLRRLHIMDVVEAAFDVRMAILVHVVWVCAMTASQRIVALHFVEMASTLGNAVSSVSATGAAAVDAAIRASAPPVHVGAVA